MVIAAVRDGLYNWLLVVHIIGAIVAIGAMFTLPFVGLAVKDASADAQRAVVHATHKAQNLLFQPAIGVTFVIGIVLILVSDSVWEFSDPWISIAFLLFILMEVVAIALLKPAQTNLLAAVDAGAATNTPADGSLHAKVGMAMGMMHLLSLLMIIDMTVKPFQ